MLESAVANGATGSLKTANPEPKQGRGKSAAAPYPVRKGETMHYHIKRVSGELVKGAHNNAIMTFTTQRNVKAYIDLYHLQHSTRPVKCRGSISRGVCLNLDLQ